MLIEACWDVMAKSPSQCTRNRCRLLRGPINRWTSHKFLTEIPQSSFTRVGRENQRICPNFLCRLGYHGFCCSFFNVVPSREMFAKNRTVQQFPCSRRPRGHFSGRFRVYEVVRYAAGAGVRGHFPNSTSRGLPRVQRNSARNPRFQYLDLSSPHKRNSLDFLIHWKDDSRGELPWHA